MLVSRSGCRRASDPEPVTVIVAGPPCRVTLLTVTGPAVAVPICGADPEAGGALLNCTAPPSPREDPAQPASDAVASNRSVPHMAAKRRAGIQTILRPRAASPWP